jgi:tetratricopeptide (TPR) repeat protein
MKSYVASLVLVLFPGVLALTAQEKQNFVINPSTPEGQILQSLGQETEDARKISLAEDFLAKYPKNEAAGWVAAQLESALLAQKDNDKVLEVAEAAYANGPDMDAAYFALKAAVAKEDADQAKKWSARTSEAARKITASAKTPADDEEKHQLEYAKEVVEYADYGLYVLALKAQPKEEVDLVDTLIKQNPKSQYLPDIASSYFAALTKAGEGGKTCPEAEKMAAGASKNAEAMIVAADCSMRAQKGAGMVTYGSKALEAINSRTKPDGTSDADWASKKESIVGSANWYVGVGYSLEGKYGPANKALHTALPLVKGNEQLHEMALFYLGLANYSLGKAIGDRGQMRQGLQFFQQASAASGPMQDQASRNAKLVLAELGGK